MYEGFRLLMAAFGFATFMTGLHLGGSCSPDYKDVQKDVLQNKVTITAEDVNKDGVDDLVLKIGEQEQVYVKSSDDGIYRPVQKVLEAQKEEEQIKLDDRFQELEDSYLMKKETDFNPIKLTDHQRSGPKGMYNLAGYDLNDDGWISKGEWNCLEDVARGEVLSPHCKVEEPYKPKEKI